MPRAICKAASPVDAVLRRGPLLICAVALLGISEAQARVFDRVEVRGAQFIPEEDIKQTCGAFPGVDYLELELRAIEDCLMTTGVFTNVKLYGEQDVLVIDVEELDDRPGRVEGALSYVSDDGLVAEFSIEKYNLFPKTYGALSLSYNSEIQAFDGALYRTDLFGPGLDFGVDLIGKDADYDDQSYSEESLRLEPYLAWEASDRTRFEAGLGLRSFRMYDVDAGASALVSAEASSRISAPYLRFALSYRNGAGPEADPDLADSVGVALQLEQYFWNLGTSDSLSDTRVSVATQWPIADGVWILSGVRGGTVSGLRDNATRSIDRFFPGAESFRGFAPRGIGPRDGADALGGNHYVVGWLEVQKEFGAVGQLPARGGVFFDAGSVWGLDDTLGGTIDDGWQTRSSVGVSLTLDIASFPVSLYVAKPLRSVPGDDRQTFGFSLSTQF